MFPLRRFFVFVKSVHLRVLHDPSPLPSPIVFRGQGSYVEYGGPDYTLPLPLLLYHTLLDPVPLTDCSLGCPFRLPGEVQGGGPVLVGEGRTGN